MAWVRYDDQYPIHRKVAGLSDAAFRLHTAAIFWSARNGTDGFVPDEDLDQVCAQVRDPARFAAECVNRRTWHLAAHACTSEMCPGPRDEPGFGLVRQEAEGRTMRYTVRGYAGERPETQRY